MQWLLSTHRVLDLVPAEQQERRMSPQSMTLPLLENIQMVPVSDSMYQVRIEPTPKRVRTFTVASRSLTVRGPC